jgi:hypothetical protein
MFACEKGHIVTADLLIAKGADVEAKNKVRQGDISTRWVLAKNSILLELE